MNWELSLYHMFCREFQFMLMLFDLEVLHLITTAAEEMGWRLHENGGIGDTFNLVFISMATRIKPQWLLQRSREDGHKDEMTIWTEAASLTNTLISPVYGASVQYQIHKSKQFDWFAPQWWGRWYFRTQLENMHIKSFISSKEIFIFCRTLDLSCSLG